MTASLDDSYRLITIDVKTANDPMPAIRLAGGDIAGRILKATGWPSGYVPRIAYNPAPDGSASGGYIESARTGIDSNNCGYAYFELPRSIFRSAHAVLAFELLDGGDTVISSRRIPVIVEPPVVNADGGEAYDGLSDLHNAVTIAKDAASKATTAESTFNQAVRDGKDAMDQATSDFITKGNQAIAADTQRVTDLIDSASIDATSHEVTPADAPSVTKNGTGTQATFDFGLPRAPHVDATAEAATDGEAAVTTTTDENGDMTLHFELPRGASIAAVTATASESGGDPAAKLTRRADGDWDLALTLPRGPQGAKGNAGDVATSESAGVIKPGLGFAVTNEMLCHSDAISFLDTNGSSAGAEGSAIIVDSLPTAHSFLVKFWLLGASGKIAKIRIFLPNFAYQENSAMSVKGSGSLISGCTCEYSEKFLTITLPAGQEYKQASGGMSFWVISVIGPTSTAAEEMLEASQSKDEITTAFAASGYTVTWDSKDHATVTRQTDPPEPSGPTADQPNSPTADTDTAQPTGPTGSSSTVTAPDTAQSDGPTIGGLS